MPSEVSSGDEEGSVEARTIRCGVRVTEIVDAGGVGEHGGPSDKVGAGLNDVGLAADAREADAKGPGGRPFGIEELRDVEVDLLVQTRDEVGGLVSRESEAATDVEVRPDGHQAEN